MRIATHALLAAALGALAACSAAPTTPASPEVSGARAPAATAPSTPPPASPAAGATPPAWAQGRPAGLEGSTLRPHAAAETARSPSEIPLERIKVPPGFKVTLWAHGMTNARSLALGDAGTVFVGTRTAGTVYAVVDRGDRREVKVIASGLNQPNGIAFRNGALYVVETGRVLRFDGIEQRLDQPPAPVVVYDALPKEAHHGWRYAAFGPDGWLYIAVGAPCNVCEPSPAHAHIRRITPDGSRMEVVAKGVRNSVGFAWHPATGELWFTDNGRDWVQDDRVPDELNRVAQAGAHFGFPYCHGGDFLDPEFGQGRRCADYVAPVAKLGPNVAALGMRFYDGDQFPAEYRRRAFIAQRGSWNRPEKSGFRVVQVVFPERGAGPAQVSVFAEGWLQGDTFWGRPIDVLVLRDGSLLVSDDYTGAIYRIAYGR